MKQAARRASLLLGIFFDPEDGGDMCDLHSEIFTSYGRKFLRYKWIFISSYSTL
jgi:hypothetical protein